MAATKTELKERAAIASKALHTYLERGDGELESAITDMLTDLRHLCDGHDLDFSQLDMHAATHYRKEVF